MKTIKTILPAIVCLFASGLVWTGPVAHAECSSSQVKKNPHHMGRIAKTMFKDMDVDSSGGVSFDEFKAVFPRTTPEGFSRLDTDGNGRLNPGEWDAFKDAHKNMGSDYSSPQAT